MRAWIGKFIAAVGAIHCVFGLVLFRTVIGELAGEGFFNTVYRQPDRAFAFWFVFIGVFWVVLGLVVDHYERNGLPLPGFLGWALAAIAAVAVVLNPKSGWWLFFVPATALIRRTRQGN